jgi:hypothetical protein
MYGIQNDQDQNPEGFEDQQPPVNPNEDEEIQQELPQEEPPIKPEFSSSINNQRNKRGNFPRL